MTTDHSLARSRARFAYDQVAKWSGPWAKEAVARVKGLPIQLRTQGLPVTLASLMQEENRASGRLAELLADWLLAHAPYRLFDDPEVPSVSARSLLQSSVQAQRSVYLAAQAEALAFLEQVKLFAVALHGGKE